MDRPTLPIVSADAPFFVVRNAGSGSDDAARAIATIRRVFDEAGRRHDVLSVEPGGSVGDIATDAVARARASGGVVVAAGGDGSLNGVAQAVLGSGCAFGVIPQGTFNYFGRTHGIPADTESATRALLRSTVRPVRVGLVNDRVFLVNASLGIYPRLLENRETHKHRFGRSRLVAFGSALATLFRRHRRLRLELATAAFDRTVDVQTLFVANNALQLEQIGVAGDDAPDRLVAFTQAPVDTLGLLKLVVRSAFGRLADAPEVSRFVFDRLDATPQPADRKRRVKVATDGEVAWLEAPLRFRVSPEPLALLVPCDNDAVPRA